MTHGDLVNVTIGGHAAVAGLAFVALLKYGLWTGEYKSWQEDLSEVVRRCERTLAIELGQRLRTVLSGAGSVVLSQIVDAYGRYVEKEVDPTESEDYRNTLFDFVKSNAGQVARYRLVLHTRDRATFWRKWLSWALYGLVVAQAILTCALATDLLGLLRLPDSSICWSILPTSVISVGCLIGLGMSLYYHNKGSQHFVERT